MISAALVTHVMRVGDSDWRATSVGWALIIYYVAIGFMIMVMCVSFLAPCMYITYTEDDNQQYIEKKSNPNTYALSQNF